MARRATPTLPPSTHSSLASRYERIQQSPARFRPWLDGSERLAQVIQGIRFRDGEPVQTAEDQAAA